MIRRNANDHRSIPSLDLLRGFEAAARHLSFTRAAQELFLTQSAVSRQIQSLERSLGTAPFLRQHRVLALTSAGATLQRAAVDALQQLAQATAGIRQRAAAPVLTVTATIGFSSLWLIPRLPEFRAAHPGADIRIAAENRLLDLEREGVEVAIRYCEPGRAPAGAQRLFGEQVLAVCSPAVARAGGGIHQPTDLCRQVLIHYDRPRAAAPWLDSTLWLEGAGVSDTLGVGSLRFSQLDQVIQAAVDGQGVALGTTPLVEKLLREGRLVAPLGSTGASSRAHYVVCSQGSVGRAQVRDFVSWLLEQAGSETTLGRATLGSDIQAGTPSTPARVHAGIR